MKPSITFLKDLVNDGEDCEISVQVFATREQALEMLAIGTRNVMQYMGISMMEYLEYLMMAENVQPDEKIFVDATMLNALSDDIS